VRKRLYLEDPIMTKRKAEASDVDPWMETVAARNELDEKRTWVIWGTGGAPPPDMREALTDNRVVEEFARAADPEWTEFPREERWTVLIPGDEDDIDALVADTGSARGYTPYLIPNRMIPKAVEEEATAAEESGELA
jgi:hypothetical protein